MKKGEGGATRRIRFEEGKVLINKSLHPFKAGYVQIQDAPFHGGGGESYARSSLSQKSQRRRRLLCDCGVDAPLITS